MTLVSLETFENNFVILFIFISHVFVSEFMGHLLRLSTPLVIEILSCPTDELLMLGVLLNHVLLVSRVSIWLGSVSVSCTSCTTIDLILDSLGLKSILFLCDHLSNG